MTEDNQTYATWWPNYRASKGDLPLSELERLLVISRRPIIPFMGGLEVCQRVHDWPAKPPVDRWWDWYNAAAAEGFCPLCPGARLDADKPKGGESNASCPCCGVAYMVRIEDDGEVCTWTTGGIGCDTLWPDEITAWEATLR